MTVEQSRKQDGSAGDADYGVIGKTYSDYRRPDSRIAQAVWDALGDARTVLNVGAGAGNYEPIDRDVTAVEPSASMRAQRADFLSTAIDAVAESLPFPDDTFDAAMTTFSVHQWGDLTAGLAEIRRVTRGPVVILTCDPDLLDRFWLAEYAPDVISTERRRYPEMSELAQALGGTVTVDLVPIPLDCTDGFNEAYYGRPEELLVAGARAACSAWSFVEPAQAEEYTAALGAAIDSGEWDTKYGALRQQPTFDGSLVIVRATP
ncbi:transcriptional regulator, MerR family [Microbacterium esteraromaticum]|uniref:Transcriptional regulator, MerR family n=1 Tax=Microbacterium esteraromaticum TaxID=57043 RepID=A0A1R4JZK9_9MICO|nr:class I SAM-dependent methyltransferase [Microbacterium esteraromaticum]SJN37344.1 transcriptional regulator, MerR family [Microbacterium esteraromaticum]